MNRIAAVKKRNGSECRESLMHGNGSSLKQKRLMLTLTLTLTLMPRKNGRGNSIALMLSLLSGIDGEGCLL
jgi:hypothetical protein